MNEPAASIAPSIPPLTDPERWEEHAGFRYTLLAQFTEPDIAAALARIGSWLYDISLEMAHTWPKPERSSIDLALAAGASDLRFLEGYLGDAGRGAVEASGAPAAAKKALRILEFAEKAGALAGEAERELAG